MRVDRSHCCEENGHFIKLSNVNKLAVNKLDECHIPYTVRCRVPLCRLTSTGHYGHRCWTNIFFPKFLHVPLGV